MSDHDGAKADRMDEHRKSAYRHLLYRALLDIRHLAWFRVNIFQILNPWHCNREIRRIRRAGVIADWLHNLAFFSALNFQEFDEGRFWRDLENLNKRNPEYDLMNYYMGIFERRLAELDREESSAD